MRQDLSRGLRGLIEAVGLWLARRPVAELRLRLFEAELEAESERDDKNENARLLEHTREQIASAERRLRKAKHGNPFRDNEPGATAIFPAMTNAHGQPVDENDDLVEEPAPHEALIPECLTDEQWAEIAKNPMKVKSAMRPIQERLTGEQRAFVGREAERFAELKYRQLKQHVQHLKAELNARHTGPSESSAYLECLELFAQIPQLRHIATRYLHEQNAAAIEQDVQALLDNVPWLRKLAEQGPMGIRLIGDPARD